MRPPFPDDEPRRFDDDDDSSSNGFSLSAGGLALLLFLISLTVFFVAGLLGYILVRTTNPHAPELHELNFPVGLWASTLTLIVSGVTMHYAQRAAATNVLGHTRLFLLATLGLGVVFLAIQVPSLAALLAEHRQGMQQQMAMYGLSTVLIVLHALHVVGGFVPLTWYTWRAMSSRGPHPQARALRYLEIYWHFLHAVWIVMFSVFVILG